jgi:hypothetical protein
VLDSSSEANYRQALKLKHNKLKMRTRRTYKENENILIKIAD